MHNDDSASTPPGRKRIIVCCDGTWMNSEVGVVRHGLLGAKVRLQVPSNVTRISRCFKRTCRDGTLQIIFYASGVGTGLFDRITGGAFGLGLSERVCEVYSFLCANYRAGDDIVLVGFSRGAFTARSVAGMVANLGLLTREGLDSFYPVLRDMQHWGDAAYRDPFPTIPFPDKPRSEDAYRARLEKTGLTRVRQPGGALIRIKAVCVWDTVGSLGIPRVSWLDALGLRPPFYDDYKWHDTALSDRIEHAFQALALDETRPPFAPAVWERREENRRTTDLRQVWFPGNHGNVGGGWPDQGIADLTLTWMMDQMASVGVEFDKPSLDRILEQSERYYRNPDVDDDDDDGPSGLRRTLLNAIRPVRWAVDPIFDNNAPFRPWALGALRSAGSLLYKLSGRTTRTPARYTRVDPRTGLETRQLLRDTNESVHASVRVRLACRGLALDDDGAWTAPALRGWRLRPATVPAEAPDRPRPRERWVWERAGDEADAPPDDERATTLAEAPLGPYERYLLERTGGSPNVYDFAARA